MERRIGFLIDWRCWRRRFVKCLKEVPNVSEAGDNSEERVLTELRDDIAQVGPKEHGAEVFVAELDAGGTLKALWEFLAPILVVSMFLSLW